MTVLAALAYMPAALIGLILIAASACWGFLSARALARRARCQARLRFGKVRVPDDGKPLTGREAEQWECFTEAWKHDRAPEPAYERRQSWDS